MNEYTVWCDKSLVSVVKNHRKVYGYEKFRLYPLSPSWGSEKEVIYSRAAARFQHLVILE